MPATSPRIELHFPVVGQTIPVDHGYLLYSALCACIGARDRSRARESSANHVFLHESDSITIGPINGQSIGNRLLAICSRRSYLRLRLPSDEISTVLWLAGKSLDVGGHHLRLRCGMIHGPV